jgi:hypothetical protein
LAELIRNENLIIPTKKAKKEISRQKAPKKSWNRQIARAKKKLNRVLLDQPPSSSSLPKDVKRRSYLDGERISQEGMEHCPHGVPKFKVCAICDPEKFREINGWD